jgi:hypothetical protein
VLGATDGVQKLQKTVALEDEVSEQATFSVFGGCGTVEPAAEFALSPDCVLTRETTADEEAAAAAAGEAGAVVLRLQSTSSAWLIRGETDEQTAVWSAALSHHISHSSLSHAAAVDPLIANALEIETEFYQVSLWSRRQLERLVMAQHGEWATVASVAGEHALGVWWGADVAVAALAGTGAFGAHGGVSDAGARGDAAAEDAEADGAIHRAYRLKRGARGGLPVAFRPCLPLSAASYAGAGAAPTAAEAAAAADEPGAPLGVEAGSSLDRVDGRPVALSSYAAALRPIAEWDFGGGTRPLVLQLRRAARHEGELLKAPVSKLAGWKKRYFVLRGGSLAYFDRKPALPPPAGVGAAALAKAAAAAPAAGSKAAKALAAEVAAASAPKGMFRLRGARVRLLDEATAGKLFCLVVHGGGSGPGSGSCTVHARNQKELLEWGSKLAFAIAAANGGGIFLHHELKHATQRTQKWQRDAADLARAALAADAEAAENAAGAAASTAAAAASAAKPYANVSAAAESLFVAVAQADAFEVSKLTSATSLAGRGDVLAAAGSGSSSGYESRGDWHQRRPAHRIVYGEVGEAGVEALGGFFGALLHEGATGATKMAALKAALVRAEVSGGPSAQEHANGLTDARRRCRRRRRRRHRCRFHRAQLALTGPPCCHRLALPKLRAHTHASFAPLHNAGRAQVRHVQPERQRLAVRVGAACARRRPGQGGVAGRGHRRRLGPAGRAGHGGGPRGVRGVVGGAGAHQQGEGCRGVGLVPHAAGAFAAVPAMAASHIHACVACRSPPL